MVSVVAEGGDAYMALYAPIATRNKAPYSSFVLLWTLSRMPRPEMARRIGKSAKAIRWRDRSEKVARSIAKAHAAAHGGTE